MTQKERYFFKPRIGEHYAEGFDGYRTLVVGVHLMCEEEECLYQMLCQSPLFIAGMDNRCPCYEQHRKGPLADYYRLSNCNAIELETYIYNDGKSPSFSAFTKYLLKEPGYVSPERKKELWDRLAFCNYLQSFRPDSNTPSYSGNQELYDNCLPAFKAILRELNPQRLYVWSDELCECLNNHSIKGLDYYGATDMQAKRVHLFFYNTIPGVKITNEQLEEIIRQKVGDSVPPATQEKLAYVTKRCLEKGFLRFDGSNLRISNVIAMSYLGMRIKTVDKSLNWKHFDILFNHPNLRGGHYDKVSCEIELQISELLKRHFPAFTKKV